ncbi:hypothetical protein K440DRAFT_44367 [Wilcoxina mikolae CBS 423.85]|nr:hypothetical protein K440DRAFT_44367 [Wilcoxina mikolae CBS 423.85]
MFLARGVSPLIQSVWHSVSILQVLFGVWTWVILLGFGFWTIVDVLGVLCFYGGFDFFINPSYLILFGFIIPFPIFGRTGYLSVAADGLGLHRTARYVGSCQRMQCMA